MNKSFYRIRYEFEVRKNRFFLFQQIQKRLTRNDSQILNNIANHKYEDAINAMKKSEEKYSFELAYCLECIGKQELATKVMKKWIEYSLEISVEYIIQKVNEIVYQNNCPYLLEYVYYGGFSNYGFIAHKVGNRIKYLTKISEISQSKNEVLFYQKHIHYIPMANTFIPKCINVSVLNSRINLITTQYINQKKVDETCEDEVIRIHRYIESYSLKSFFSHYKDIKELYQGNDEVSYLDKKITYLMMFEKMENILNTTPSSEHILIQLKEVKKEFLLKKIHKYVKFDQYYSFCHNDFHRKNMYQSEHTIYVIDWNNYRYGFKGWDTIYYWGNFERTFDYIRINYIEKTVNMFNNEQDKIIWSILYSFLLIYVWIARLHKQCIVKYQSEYFNPAFEYIQMKLERI